MRAAGVIGDPATAPPRPDLTFLRRRSRPAEPSPARPSPPSNAAVADFLSGRTGRPGRQGLAASPPASSVPISFDRPGRRAAAPAPAPAAPGSLDLSTPSPPTATPTPSGGGSLDLSESGAARTPAGSPTPSRPPAVALPVHDGRRIAGHEQRLLSVKAPTVTLTRVQSGIGQLSIEAVCSPEVGDLRLGAAYQLRGGGSSVVQFTGGNRFAPSSRRPIIVTGREEYEYLRLDLRQVRDLERLAVYAFSEARRDLTWGGTLVLTTFGGGRVELPLETLPPGRVAVLLSIYNLHGELVVRAEMETIDGDIREAARAYGYDRITWRDDRSPVD